MLSLNFVVVSFIIFSLLGESSPSAQVSVIFFVNKLQFLTRWSFSSGKINFQLYGSQFSEIHSWFSLRKSMSLGTEGQLLGLKCISYTNIFHIPWCPWFFVYVLGGTNNYKVLMDKFDLVSTAFLELDRRLFLLYSITSSHCGIVNFYVLKLMPFKSW